MPGRVFISCGQRDGEREVALRVQELLQRDFGLEGYLAFKVQSLNDIMSITEELRKSDYYLFIDFLRRVSHASDFTCSLFTHQELALAHHLGFRDMVALQQDGVRQEGFVRYLLSNPEPFTDTEDLLRRIANLAQQRRWSPSYSRHLVVSNPQAWAPHNYTDHTGTFVSRAWTVDIENRRPDAAAVRVVCILDSIEDNLGPQPSSDRSFLKWWGFHQSYEGIILPLDSGRIDLLSVHQSQPGVFLRSQMDLQPRRPIVLEQKPYLFNFKVFAEGFPLLKFSARFNYRGSASSSCEWDDSVIELAP